MWQQMGPRTPTPRWNGALGIQFLRWDGQDGSHVTWHQDEPGGNGSGNVGWECTGKFNFRINGAFPWDTDLEMRNFMIFCSCC